MVQMERHPLFTTGFLKYHHEKLETPRSLQKRHEDYIQRLYPKVRNSVPSASEDTGVSLKLRYVPGV